MTSIKSNLLKGQTSCGVVRLLPVVLGGRVRYAHGEVVVDAAAKAGTVIELVKLPKGARVLPISQIHFEAGQAVELTVKVGDGRKTDRYLEAVAPGTTASSITLNGNRFADYILPEETTLVLTTGGADLAAGKKMVFDVFYVVD